MDSGWSMLEVLGFTSEDNVVRAELVIQAGEKPKLTVTSFLLDEDRLRAVVENFRLVPDNERVPVGPDN